MKPQRAILEANMGGDKKPSFEYFQSGHGKTVLAEATLTEDAVRRVLRTKLDDLARARLGRDARGDRLRDAVGRVHARDRDRGGLRRDRPGPRHGRDELDGARRRPPRRGRAAGLDPPARARGGDDRRRHDAPLRPRAGSSCSAARAPARSTASPRSWPRRRWRSRSRPPPRWPPPARPSSSGRTTSAAGFAESSDAAPRR